MAKPLAQVIEAVASESRLDGSLKLTAFAPLFGSNFEGELLLVGRAVNGWLNPWTVQEARSPDVRCEIAETAIIRSNRDGERCAMEWVEGMWSAPSGYRTGASAFWRVAREVVIRVTGRIDNGIPWSSHLVWTNLYKAAPADTGNPSGRLQAAQRARCVEMHNTEIEMSEPKRALFLTGQDWVEPFRARLGMEPLAMSRDRLVQEVGSFTSGNTPGVYVIARHPQGKPESQMVQQICTAFGATLA